MNRKLSFLIILITSNYLSGMRQPITLELQDERGQREITLEGREREFFCVPFGQYVSSAVNLMKKEEELTPVIQHVSACVALILGIGTALATAWRKSFNWTENHVISRYVLPIASGALVTGGLFWPLRWCLFYWWPSLRGDRKRVEEERSRVLSQGKTRLNIRRAQNVLAAMQYEYNKKNEIDQPDRQSREKLGRLCYLTDPTKFNRNHLEVACNMLRGLIEQ